MRLNVTLPVTNTCSYYLLISNKNTRINTCVTNKSIFFYRLDIIPMLKIPTQLKIQVFSVQFATKVKDRVEERLGELNLEPECFVSLSFLNIDGGTASERWRDVRNAAVLNSSEKLKVSLLFSMDTGKPLKAMSAVSSQLLCI